MIVNFVRIAIKGPALIVTSPFPSLNQMMYSTNSHLDPKSLLQVGFAAASRVLNKSNCRAGDQSQILVIPQRVKTSPDLSIVLPRLRVSKFAIASRPYAYQKSSQQIAGITPSSCRLSLNSSFLLWPAGKLRLTILQMIFANGC